MQNKIEQKVEDTLSLLFAHIEGKCYVCGKGGHKSPQCYLRNVTPRNEWAVSKLESFDKDTEAKIQKTLSKATPTLCLTSKS